MNKKLILNGKESEFQVTMKDERTVEVILQGKSFTFDVKGESEGKIILGHQGRNYPVAWSSQNTEGKTEWFLNVAGREAKIKLPERAIRKNTRETAGGLKSPMPGKVFKVLVKAGDLVTKGQTLMILEAMKMEHSIKAPEAGVVEAIYFNAGAQVSGGVKLMDVKAK